MLRHHLSPVLHLATAGGFVPFVVVHRKTGWTLHRQWKRSVLYPGRCQIGNSVVLGGLRWIGLPGLQVHGLFGHSIALHRMVSWPCTIFSSWIRRGAVHCSAPARYNGDLFDLLPVHVASVAVVQHVPSSVGPVVCNTCCNTYLVGR